MIDITTLGGKRIDENTFKQLIKQIKLKITEDYKFPPEIITLSGATIATLGNFSASTGKPKSKKTFNVSAIVAACLSGKEILNYKASLPEGKKKILYIDTEQSKYHCHKVMERIFKLAGLPTNTETDMIDFFVLREYTPEQRRDIINLALNSNSEYGLVVVDGVRDLLRDINNPSEALDIINDFMRWSSYYNLHIHTVLHLNKGDDNTRGHIGTELNNKAETVLQITKSLDDPDMSEVKAMFIRDKESAPFAFRIDSNGLPQTVDGYKAEMSRDKKMHYSKLKNEQHREAIESVIGNNTPVGYNQMIILLQNGYSNIGYSRGRNTIINLLKYLLNMGFIAKIDKTYQYVYEEKDSGQSDSK